MPTRRRPTPVIRPSVVFAPNLFDGINAMADAVKSTLGPLPRLVGIERISRATTPELLDDAGTIARRIVQIEDETADVGAMMLRHAMWRMRERTGDGAATMAVLCQAMLQGAARGLAAGMHPMSLRRGIERGASAVVEELRRCARPLPPGQAGRAVLFALARSLSADSELTGALVRAVYTVGGEGMVDVVVGNQRDVEVEFVEGAMWDAGWASAAYVTDKARGLARQEDVAVIVLDGRIDTPQQAFAGIQRIAEAGVTRAAIVAGEINDEALKVFTQVHLQGVIRFVLVKAPGTGEEHVAALQDISALTGARILFTPEEFTLVTAEDMGYARRMWSTAIKFGIIAGRRQGDVLRAQVEVVRNTIANFNDKKEWPMLRKLRWRLARLTGGIAVLQVGALTRDLADTRREQGERLVQTLQQALSGGLVAGGGAALLACQAVVERAAADESLKYDERYGVRCVAEALRAPISLIAHNAGLEPKPLVAQVLQAGGESGIDALNGQVVDMWEAGIIDALPVIERAVQTAASVAVMAVTTHVVVHQKKHYPGLPTP
jgi:chaperonin GroEL